MLFSILELRIRSEHHVLRKDKGYKIDCRSTILSGAIRIGHRPLRRPEQLLHIRIEQDVSKR
jgi:hypothetical protein